MLMHPIASELEGQLVGNMKDPNGVSIFIEFVKTVNASSSKDGFVYYQWPKPGFKEPVNKVSYVKKFEPWGWILGSGVYLDTVDEIFWQKAKFVIIITLAITLMK